MGLSTMGTASLVTQAAGGIAGAIGAYDAAAMRRGNFEFQADMAEINAEIAEDRADNALFIGQTKIADLTQQAGALEGRQRAAMAANGIVLGEGSAGEVIESTEFMKQRDMQRIELQSIYNAWGYDTQAGNYQTQAAMSRASAAAQSPFMAGAGSLLGSAGTVAKNWYRMKYYGA